MIKPKWFSDSLRTRKNSHSLLSQWPISNTFATEWTWPWRGTFCPILGLSRAIRDIWSPYLGWPDFLLCHSGKPGTVCSGHSPRIYLGRHPTPPSPAISQFPLIVALARWSVTLQGVNYIVSSRLSWGSVTIRVLVRVVRPITIRKCPPLFNYLAKNSFANPTSL